MNRNFFKLSNILLNNSVSRNCFSRDYSYSSAVSLTKLYPNSNQKITTPNFVPLETESKFDGFVPVEKLDITYMRSSGPGGQNVNKRETKVEVRFKLDEADWIHPELREKIFKNHKTQISKEGYLIVKSDVTRSQHLNLAHCMKLLRNIIWKANEPEKQMSEETMERIKKGKEKANRERLMKKREDSYKRNLYKAPTALDL